MEVCAPAEPTAAAWRSFSTAMSPRGWEASSPCTSVSMDDDDGGCTLSAQPTPLSVVPAVCEKALLLSALQDAIVDDPMDVDEEDKQQQQQQQQKLAKEREDEQSALEGQQRAEEEEEEWEEEEEQCAEEQQQQQQRAEEAQQQQRQHDVLLLLQKECEELTRRTLDAEIDMENPVVRLHEKNRFVRAWMARKHGLLLAADEYNVLHIIQPTHDGDMLVVARFKVPLDSARAVQAHGEPARPFATKSRYMQQARLNKALQSANAAQRRRPPIILYAALTRRDTLLVHTADGALHCWRWGAASTRNTYSRHGPYDALRYGRVVEASEHMLAWTTLSGCTDSLHVLPLGDNGAPEGVLLHQTRCSRPPAVVGPGGVRALAGQSVPPSAALLDATAGALLHDARRPRVGPLPAAQRTLAASHRRGDYTALLEADGVLLLMQGAARVGHGRVTLWDGHSPVSVSVGSRDIVLVLFCGTLLFYQLRGERLVHASGVGTGYNPAWIDDVFVDDHGVNVLTHGNGESPAGATGLHSVITYPFQTAGMRPQRDGLVRIDARCVDYEAVATTRSFCETMARHSAPPAMRCLTAAERRAQTTRRAAPLSGVG